MVLLLLSTSSFACHSKLSPSADSLPQGEKDLQTGILEYVNQYRAGLHKPPLQMLSDLNAVATSHSMDMATGKTSFGHEGFDARWTSILKLEPSMKAMGENVAYGNISAKEVVNLWVGSEGHRKNLEGDFNYTGIGIAKSNDGTLFFTEIYIRK